MPPVAEQATAPADEEEAVAARAALAVIAEAESAHQAVGLGPTGRHGGAVALTPRALGVVRDALRELAAPHLGPDPGGEAELTVREAANRLGVSVRFLAGVLDRGEVPHRVGGGGDRRVRLVDLRAYERAVAARGDAALAEIAAEARRLRLD